MSRRNNWQQKFPNSDPLLNSYLISLLTVRILKSGKKSLAQNIIYDAFLQIKKRTNLKPLWVFEKAVKNVSPNMELRSTRVRASTYQVPVEVSRYRATILALRWIVHFSRARPGRSMAIKLATEIIDASKGRGNSIRKKEETHRMAEANKAFSHYRRYRR